MLKIHVVLIKWNIFPFKKVRAKREFKTNPAVAGLVLN